MASRFVLRSRAERRAWTVLLFLGLSCVLACRARAEAAASPLIVPRGIAANGLCGLAYAEYPLCPAHVLTASVSAGYGYTGSVPPNPGHHTRVAGSVAVGFLPLDWLALSLRFDGRRDTHPPDEDGPDSTMVGDPRLQVRLGRALSELSALGVSAVVWLPGTRAPSIRPSATSVDLKLLGSHQARPGTWSILGSLGFRLDQSAKSAPDKSRLRPGDRLSLNLSDSNALLGVLGANRRVGPRGEVFVELSADLLIGSGVPIGQSPLRISLGARYFFSNTFQLETTATGSLSQSASVAPDQPWIPSEPRVYVGAGLRYGRLKSKPPAARSNQTLAATGPPEIVEKAQKNAAFAAVSRSASVTGVVLDQTGEPLSEATIGLHLDGGTWEAVSDTAGKYTFTNIPSGAAELQLSASGFLDRTARILITEDMAPLADQRLELAAETGLLRCVVRSFASEPLKAEISLHGADGSEVAKGESNEHGMFEIQLPPGPYQVIITAPGYRSHRRNVSVSTNGVAILNLDMREL